MVALKEVKNALPEKIHDDADVAAEVETISEVDAPIAVLLIVCLEGSKHAEFDAGCIAILLYRTNNLDGNMSASTTVLGHDDLAKSSLSEKLHHLI